jgi:4-amino-4-deoxy-L-arabinose transferase-like glycosyltransferase
MAGEIVTSPPRPRVRSIASVGSLTVGVLCAITALGFALRLANFGQVPGNSFYDAAVRSMGLSWHNLFYGAFEPGAQVAVDKTPVDLWLQVASTKLFGFNGTAMRLPEAFGGALAVPLLYDLVRRMFGRVAGLGAAAALAVLPISVLTSHSDTMDSLMMLLDVGAAWLVVVAAQRRSAWLLAAAGAVLGLAFNVKIFEGLIVLPALALLAWMASDLPSRRKLRDLAGALAAFVAVSLSWVTAASIAAAGRGPWPIGSTNGSVWNVVFGFNGIDRLRSHASAAALKLDPPGPLRMLTTGGHDYAALIGATLVAAVVFGGLALLAVRLRRGSRLATAGAVFVGVWLVCGIPLVSVMQRLQPRYLEALTPAVAAALGIGVAVLARRAPRLLAVGAAVSAAAGVALVHSPSWAIAAAAVGAVLVALAVVSPSRARAGAAPALAACALVAALAVPTASAVRIAQNHNSDAGLTITIPGLDRLSAFLIRHQGTSPYEVTSASVMRASPLIVRDARPVLMLTSYNSRPLLTPAQLARLVRAGQARYLLTGGGGGAPVVRWARAHSRDVSAAAGLPKGTLYKLSPTVQRKANPASTGADASRRTMIP